MADARSLKFIGLVFGIATLAVMSATVFVVNGHAEGRYTIDGASTAMSSK